MTQNNLGDTYLTLAEVRDKEANAQNAINAYQEALKVYTAEKFPTKYSRAQRNLEGAKELLI
jgi:hypothetical protein